MSSTTENEGKVLGSETEANLKDLFVFLTGSDRIPPMGFTRKGKIAFDHRDNSQELRFPSVSTCQPMLQLPMCDDLTQDYDSFKEKMNLAVLGSVGFCNPSKLPDRHWRAVYQNDKCSLSSRDNPAR